MPVGAFEHVFAIGDRAIFHCPLTLDLRAYRKADGKECEITGVSTHEGRSTYDIKFDAEFDDEDPYAFPEELTPVEGIML